jgi:hypothetical protein
MEVWKNGSMEVLPAALGSAETNRQPSTVNRQPDWAIQEIRTKFADSNQHVWPS